MSLRVVVEEVAVGVEEEVAVGVEVVEFVVETTVAAGVVAAGTVVAAEMVVAAAIAEMAAAAAVAAVEMVAAAAEMVEVDHRYQFQFLLEHFKLGDLHSSRQNQILLC